MTLQEFNQRTNANLTEQQYSSVEEMYMNAGDIDKDVFCNDWKKHNDSTLLIGFYEQYLNYKKNLVDLNCELVNLHEFLVVQAEKTGSKEIRDMAVKMYGFRSYIKTRLKKGFGELWEVDRIELNAILQQIITCIHLVLKQQLKYKEYGYAD